MAILLGAIGDDVTGSTDLALMLSKHGMSVIQTVGLPPPGTVVRDAQAVVVALKSRTAPVEQAVADSLSACDWLVSQGARQIFFKYCSTFDSTEKGNIGRVAAHIAQADAAHRAAGDESWGQRVAAELITLLRDDYPTLMNVLSALGDALPE